MNLPEADAGMSLGEVHDRQKKIIAPVFFASRLKVFVPMFQDAASKVLAFRLCLSFGGD